MLKNDSLAPQPAYHHIYCPNILDPDLKKLGQGKKFLQCNFNSIVIFIRKIKVEYVNPEVIFDKTIFVLKWKIWENPAQHLVFGLC